jgi:hypothetical protein
LNPGRFVCFSFIFISFGESRLLVSCAGGRCDMAGSDEARGRSRRPSAKDQGWSQRSNTRWPDDREVGWRRVRSAPCTWRRGVLVSWLSHKTKIDSLSVVWPQNHWDNFLWFGLKTGGYDFLVELQNQGGVGFLGLGLKTKQTIIYRLRHKTDGRAITCKQVGVGFFSLTARLTEARQ